MVLEHSNPEAMLEALPLPVGVIDTDGRVLRANRMFSSLPEDVRSSPDFSAFLRRGRKEGSGSARIRIGSDCCTVLGKAVMGPGGCLIVVALVPGGALETEGRCRLAILAGIMRAATSPNSLRETLAAVAEKTVALMDFDAGAIYLIEKSGTSAARRADAGLYHLYFPEIVGTGERDWAEVFSEGRAYYGEAYLGVAHEKGELGVYSRAIVPISLPSGMVIGALAIANSNFHPFSPLERETLEAIGREVGGVIHKTALADDLAAAKAEGDLYLDVLTHDINNANNVAIGYLEMLREEVSGEPSIFAGKCLSGIRQSCRIIDQVRVLRACQQEPVLHPISLDAVIRSVVDGFPGVFITYDGTKAVVRADDLLPRIFENLIGNSLKHGGADVRIAVDVAEDGGGVGIRVGDTGPGIPPEAREKVFERFFRNTHSQPGQGLGLYIVGTLVHRYGGEIRVEDRVQGRPEEGAAFCFTLKKA